MKQSPEELKFFSNIYSTHYFLGGISLREVPQRSIKITNLLWSSSVYPFNF